MKSLFLALVVTVVLGAAFLFSRTGPDSDSGAAGLDGPGTAQAATPVLADSPELDAVEENDQSTRDQAPALAAPKASGESSQASVEDEPVAMATLRGRITDADGVGLGGGEVEAKAPFRGLSMMPQDEVARTEAKDDGSFLLSVRAGDLSVSFGADGYAPHRQSVSAGPGQTVDLGDVRLPEGVKISGRVTNDRGLPVEGAQIHRPVVSDGAMIQLGVLGALASTTDAGGYFEILRQAVGPFEFTVDHAEHLRGSFEGSTKSPGEVAHGIEVTLAKGVSIAGNVVDLPDDVVPNTLHAFARMESSGGRIMAFDFGGGFDSSGRRSSPVADDGSFQILGLKPGTRYEVWVQASRNTWRSGVRRSEHVKAQSGDTGVRVTYREGASVTLAILDEDGAAVANPTIRGGFEYERNFEDTEVDGDPGTHALRHIWPPTDNTSFNLTIEARGFETFSRKGIDLVAHGEVDLGTITLKPKPQLEVTVLDGTTGRPVEGARVSLQEVTDGSTSGAVRFSASVSADMDEVDDLADLDFSMLGKEVQVTDEDGKCTLDVEPGTSMHVDVVHAGYAEMRTDPVRIGPGTAMTESTVKLLPGGSVSVLVRDPEGHPLPGARVERRREEGRPSPSKVVTGKDGTALLTGLEPGVHGLRLAEKKGSGGIVMMANMPGADSGAPWTEVTVEPGLTVEATLQAEPPMHVVGTITEAGAPLAGAKVSLRGTGPMSGFPGILGGSGSATTDARGRFRLENVKGGDSKLVISHGSRAMDYEHALEVEAGENEVNLDLGVTIVEGTVRDHEGDPLAGAKVKVAREAQSGSRAMVSFVMTTDDGDGGGGTFFSGGPGEPEPVMTDSEGRYSLRGVQAGVDIAVSATADGYDTAKSEPFKVDAGEVRGGVDLAFVLTGSIQIQVEGGAGGMIAILRRRGAGIRDPRIENFSGTAKTIEGLAPGTWTVSLSSLGGPDARFTPEELEIEVEAGETSQANFERVGR